MRDLTRRIAGKADTKLYRDSYLRASSALSENPLRKYRNRQPITPPESCDGGNRTRGELRTEERANDEWNDFVDFGWKVFVNDRKRDVYEGEL